MLCICQDTRKKTLRASCPNVVLPKYIDPSNLATSCNPENFFPELDVAQRVGELSNQNFFCLNCVTGRMLTS